MHMFHFWFFEPPLARKWAWPPCTPIKPDQKVGPLGGPFEPTAISKSCLQNFQGRVYWPMFFKVGHLVNDSYDL